MLDSILGPYIRDDNDFRCMIILRAGMIRFLKIKI